MPGNIETSGAVGLNNNQKTALRNALKALSKIPKAEPFLYPVDSTIFPDYYQVISNPMDIQTINDKMNAYKSIEEAIVDVNLIWDNCRKYNAEGSAIYQTANELESDFVELIKDKIDIDESRKKKIKLSIGSESHTIVGTNTQDLKKTMRNILTSLKRSPYALPFLKPVDFNDAPGYLEFVSTPMDLSTIDKNLKEGKYEKMSAFEADVKLISSNCLIYNDPTSDIANYAIKLEEAFYSILDSLNIDVDVSLDSTTPGKIDKHGKKNDYRKMKNILDEIMSDKLSEVFRVPVNFDEAPGYLEVIKQPMDLSTIASKLENSVYDTIEKFVSDMRLVFDNCCQYNSDTSAIYDTATELRNRFDDKVISTFGNAFSKKKTLKKKDSPLVRSAIDIDVVDVNDLKQITPAILSTLSKENLEILLERIKSDGCNHKLVRQRCIDIAKESLEKVVNIWMRNDTFLLEYIGDIAMIGNILIAGYNTTDIIFPRYFTSVVKLRLTVTSHQKLTKYADISLKNEIVGDIKSTSVPLFRVTLDDTVIAEGQNPRAVWESIPSLAPKMVKFLGSKLQRCRAVFNRLCIHPDVLHFIDPVPQNGAIGQEYYKLIKAPMWLREVHNRLVSGVYDSEFDFAWDVRLIFQNCQHFNKPGSDLYNKAGSMMALFEDLFCQWVINIRNRTIDDIAKGEWDSWMYLKYFDSSDPTQNFCCETKEVLPESQLISCISCEDQYQIKKMKVKNAKEVVDTWMCERCTIAQSYCPLKIANNEASKSIQVMSSYCTEEFGKYVFLPAPDIGYGWLQAKRKDRKTVLINSFMSPLGWFVTGRGKEELHKRMQEENIIHETLLNERCLEFSNNSNGKSKPHNARRNKDKSSQAEKEDNYMTLGQFATCYAGVDDVIVLLVDKATLASSNAKSKQYLELNEAILPSAGLFGFDFPEIRVALESYDELLGFSQYKFLQSDDIYEVVLADIKASLDRMLLSDAVDSVLFNSLRKIRYRRDYERIDNTYFHKCNNSSTTASGKQSVFHSVAVPLFAPQTQISSSEGDAMLAIWDFMDVLSPIIGELSFTFSDVLDSVVTPTDAHITHYGQIIFDEICTTLTGILLLEVKNRLNFPSDVDADLFLMSKPLNIFTWPQVSRICIQILTLINFCGSNAPVAFTYERGDQDLQRDILCALLNHPNMRFIKSCDIKMLDDIVRKVFPTESYNEVENQNNNHYNNIDELLVDLTAAFTYLKGQQSFKTEEGKAISELIVWLNDVFIKIGKSGSIPYYNENKSVYNLSANASHASFLSDFKNNTLQLRTFINPFDFGNKQQIECGSSLPKNVALNVLEKLQATLLLLRSKDPDEMQKVNRLDTYSTLLHFCAATDIFRKNVQQRKLPTLSIKESNSLPMDELERVPETEGGNMCYFSGLAYIPGEIWYYVPKYLLDDSIPIPSKNKPIASLSALKKAHAANELGLKENFTIQNYLKHCMRELVNSTGINSIPDEPEIFYERSMPIGYDRYGAEYWIVNAQQNMTISAIGQHLCNKPPFSEPCVFIKCLDGTWYRTVGDVSEWIHCFGDLDVNLNCERILKENLLDRLYTIKKSYFKYLFNPNYHQTDILKKIDFGKKLLNNNPFEGKSEQSEIMKVAETLYCRYAELRLNIHSYLLFEDKEQKEKDPRREECQNLKGEKAEKEIKLKRVRRMKPQMENDHFDYHSSKGYLRLDRFSLMRMISAVTTASRIHTDSAFFIQFKDIMEKSPLRLKDQEVSNTTDLVETVNDNEDVSNEMKNEENMVNEDVKIDQNTFESKDQSHGNVDNEQEEIIFGEFDTVNTFTYKTGSRRGNKPVEQLHAITEEVLRTYPSGTDAAEYMKISNGGISLCCSGKQQEFCGYRWRFYSGPSITNFEELNAAQLNYDAIIKLSQKGSVKSVHSKSPGHHVDDRKKVAYTTNYPHHNTRIFLGPNFNVAKEVMSIRLVRLKVELTNIIYAIPERKFKFSDTKKNSGLKEQDDKDDKDDKDDDKDDDREESKQEKEERKAERRRRRREGLANLHSIIENANNVLELTPALIQLEQLLVPYLFEFDDIKVPLPTSTCAEFALRLFTLDRAIQYDSNSLRDKFSCPEQEGFKRSHLPRYQHVLKCAWSCQCSSYMGHPDGCLVGTVPLNTFRTSDIIDKASYPQGQYRSSRPLAPYSNQNLYNRSLLKRKAEDGDDDEEDEFEYRVKSKRAPQADIENIYPRPPPKSITEIVIV